ncbi:MAG TPA: histidine kinase dimerization/phospho-acceptor domain-containing protein [Spongiibacteraceae bacterium]|nr:histidine kinase dimerization/phospho-acceptor domain-containing protein [Spongiibacteraceae bacterium]
MNRSLKRRLTAIVISIFIASWILSALATSLAARLVISNEIDRVLESILLAAESISGSMNGELEPLRKIYEKKIVPVAYAAGTRTGDAEQPMLLRLQQNLYSGGLGVPSVNLWFERTQILVGNDTPAFPRPHAGIREGQANNVDIDGLSWRIMYRHSEANHFWVAAGIQNQRARLDGTQLLLQMLAPLVVLIPLTALALYYGVARGLFPLRRLAREIERREEMAALQPLPAGDVPSELVPVVDSLNHLLARLADTLENEKRFTANAAHELQTPLAAISTEVQLCHRLLTDPESKRMMERIRVRVERASHSVKQLLILARLDPQNTLPMQTVDLSELIREVASELGHIASDRQLELALDIDAQQTLQGNRETLLILLRNLLSNAFRYTPRAGTVRICRGSNRLTITNAAAPIADPEQLADRFFRGSGDSDEDTEPGAGLGLSIVKRICELHGITLTLNYLELEKHFLVALQFS